MLIFWINSLSRIVSTCLINNFIPTTYNLRYVISINMSSSKLELPHAKLWNICEISVSSKLFDSMLSQTSQPTMKMAFTTSASWTSFWSDIEGYFGCIFIIKKLAHIRMKHCVNQSLTKLFSETFDKFN